MDTSPEAKAARNEAQARKAAVHRIADARFNNREASVDDTQLLLNHMAAVHIHNTWLRDFVHSGYLQEVAAGMNRVPPIRAMAFAAGNTASAPAITIASPGGWADALTAGLVDVLPKDAVDSWLELLNLREELKVAHQVHDSRVLLRARELYDTPPLEGMKPARAWVHLDDEAKAPYIEAARLELAGDAPPSIH